MHASTVKATSSKGGRNFDIRAVSYYPNEAKLSIGKEMHWKFQELIAIPALVLRILEYIHKDLCHILSIELESSMFRRGKRASFPVF